MVGVVDFCLSSDEKRVGMKTRYSKEMSGVNRLYRETDGIYLKYASIK